jgi:hypothetical protein
MHLRNPRIMPPLGGDTHINGLFANRGTRVIVCLRPECGSAADSLTSTQETVLTFLKPTRSCGRQITWVLI